jgi:sugar phosphate isomerase/epimerase
VGDDPVAVARRLAERTAMVHLKDVEPGGWRGPTGPASVAYGTGAIDVAGVVDELVAARFAGPICVELGHLGGGDVDERALVAECVDWLRDRLAS